ncbi:CcoQ/FixQ family Cbb3-type cytochrome c oxidase assembly chaperone [Massilia sp. BSC265]|uniref:cbb3-type cytochrome oxidase subunit 3 n=1 Tax=Massilia sp. BSC265 TaxID=1549812 RepID=UPI0004E86FAD|nr:CcoQ/FixQ family Cbb3-type cytochrome c oxidase assembly chaperone [Massilia sp. BSC265]KFI08364.1 Cbb3-type cytochrome oxidase component FixQ [Massilia sp. BSC265]
MAIQQIFDDASSVMTVISFVTFLGIVGWTYVLRRSSDFDKAAQLPFMDDAADKAGESNRG